MNLPEYFSFNQQNLQDYVDCPRRFFLRHVLKQDWPAIESEPVHEQEKLIAQGEQFHRSIQRFFAGIPDKIIENSISDPDLLNWWHQFIQMDFQSQPGVKFCETSFSAPFEGFRIVAKYDLLVYKAGQKAVIYDWKTSQHAPRRKWLDKRMQTKVYPFVLAILATQPPFKIAITPDQIEMRYWYPAFPETPIQFSYSQSQFSEDQHDLQKLVQEILHLDEAGFTKTENETLCKFCRYRSLCDRGILAGERSETEELEEDSETAFDIDFDQISPTV